MKILLISIGTRGDMEPFLAIGEMLKAKGHQVICFFPEQFRELAEESGLEFSSLGPKFIDQMMHSDAGKMIMGGSASGLKKISAYIKLAREFKEINKDLVKVQYDIIKREKPDRILYNGKALYPIIWGLDNIGKNILISPVPYLHYVKNHTHIGFHSNYGTFLNKLTFRLAHFGEAMAAKMSAKWLKLKRKIKRKEIKNALVKNKTIYTISPTLLPRPDYWPKNLQILGFHERDKTVNWKPDKELTGFIDKHDKILFVTFGSMINTKPEDKTKIILEVLEQYQIPAIISTGFGGLIKPKEYNTNLFYFVQQIPYDWIFPKIYGVIHHGGAGTTHMALKYGCASMIIPHFIDQYAWNDIINELGVGPNGIAINKITKRKLETKVLDLFKNQSYKEKALEIAEKMRKENLVEKLYTMIIE